MKSSGARQLTAVLRVDMVASTELLAGSGVAAAIEARRAVTAAIDENCAAGFMIETRGDATMVGFASAHEALRSAWNVQQVFGQPGGIRLRAAVTVEELDHKGPIDLAAHQRSQDLEARCAPGAVVAGERGARAVQGVSGVALSHGIDPTTVVAIAAGQQTPGSLRCVLFSDVAFDSPAHSDGGLPDAQALSKRSILDNGGVIVDLNSLGHVALFESCEQALAAAEAHHVAAASANHEGGGRSPFAFRVGLSVGEIVALDDGTFGVAVVEAARLLEQAAPAVTLLSADVRVLAGVDRPDLEHVGPTNLKGLAAPVDVSRITHSRSPQPLLELPAVYRREPRFPMVGRERPAGTLTERWELTDLGGSLVLVSGAEGVGKTRLLREFASVVHTQGALVLHGGCDEDLRTPFAPIVEALSPAKDLDAALSSGHDAGSGALGVLFSRRDPGDRSSNEHGGPRQEDQTVLFDAVANALERLSVVRPVLLVVDDAQAAGPDTIRMLEHVARRTADSRVLLVVTCRSEAMMGEHPVLRLRDFSADGRRADHLRLERLDTGAVRALLEAAAGSELVGEEAETAEKIAAITGGNPLYVEELVVHLAETNALVHHPDTGWKLAVDVDEIALPDSIVDVMVQRLERLGAEALEVLAVAATMGSTFDTEVVAAVTERTLVKVLDVLEAAETTRLVQQEGNGENWEFADEVVRAAVLRDVRAARRASLHQQIAEALESLGSTRYDQLALHWSAAPGRAARSKAIRYLQLAADRDMAVLAWESAVARQRQVVQLLAVDDVDDPAAIGPTRLVLGSALRLLGDQGYAAELTQAADCARRLSDPALLFQSAVAMMRPGAWYPEAGIVDDRIVAMCEDALLLGPDDALRARILAALATNLAYDNDVSRRAALIAEAQQLADASGDLHLRGTALAAELISLHDPHLFLRREAIADEVRHIGRTTADRHLQFTGLWFVLAGMLARGEMDRLKPLLSQARELAEANRDYHSQFFVGNLEVALSIAADEDDVATKIDAAQARFEDDPIDSFATWVLHTGVKAMASGTLSEMLLPMAQAADMWHEEWGQKWDYALVKAYLDMGDTEAALQTLEESRPPDNDSYWIASICQLALVGLRLERPDVCQQVIDQLTTFRGRLAVIGHGIAVAGQVSTALGQAHLGLRHLAEAEELLREALAQAEALGFPYFVVHTRRFLAETLLARDPNSTEANDLLHSVIAVSAERSFALEAAEATKLLRL